MDDTVIFMDNGLEKAKNMKLLLFAFEQLSRLKINFHKSEFFFMEQLMLINWNIHKFSDVM